MTKRGLSEKRCRENVEKLKTDFLICLFVARRYANRSIAANFMVLQFYSIAESCATKTYLLLQKVPNKISKHIF